MQSSQIHFWFLLKGYVVDSKANMQGVRETSEMPSLFSNVFLF